MWAEIQLYAFTSARVDEYIESTCRKGSDRGLHFRVRVSPQSLSLDDDHCTKAHETEYRL